VVQKDLYAVVMAGGKGTRFWPLSRETFPKQFLRLLGGKTLLQETIHRLQGLLPKDHFLVITTEAQRDLVHWQSQEAEVQSHIVVEPQGKNTAAAVALAAFKLAKKHNDALMLVLPSDHYIGDAQAFKKTILRALPAARKGYLVTFGILPSRAETGYGYLKASSRALQNGIYKVQRFVEKPPRRQAEAFLKDGSYYWNSGIFLFSVRSILREFRRHMPELYKGFAKVKKALGTEEEPRALQSLYRELPEQSIDYGVMERSSRVAMVRAEFPWSDIGSWGALQEVLQGDPSGNILLGNVLQLDSHGSVLFSSGRLVAALGLRDMVVVDSPDAVLVCPKDRVQEVKALVERLKEEGKEEYLTPRVEERPWGHFVVLERGPNYQIKLICLKPKARLSLQMHAHRSEHWIVVSGVARVQRGEEVFYVHRDQSTYIPPTVKHRLENPGLIPLKIIEIQSGEHLVEEDITRFDDIYGRRQG